jgi:hypothetical protein
VQNDGKIYIRSDLEDYEFRGHVLEDLCFLDFIVGTYEEHKNKRTENETTDDLITPMDDEIDQDTMTSHRKPGRPESVRAEYVEGHSRKSTHIRVVRNKNHKTLPSIIGPFFPRRDDKEHYDFYCASMLSLLKPWRHIQKLKDDDESWENAFNKFIKDAPPKVHNILAGIQYYYDCKAAAERLRNKDKGAYHDEGITDTREYEMQEDEQSCEEPTETMVSIHKYEAKVTTHQHHDA